MEDTHTSSVNIDSRQLKLILQRMLREGEFDWVNLGDVEAFVDEVAPLRGLSHAALGQIVAFVVGNALDTGLFHVVRMDATCPGGRAVVDEDTTSVTSRVADIYRAGVYGRWFEVLLEKIDRA